MKNIITLFLVSCFHFSFGQISFQKIIRAPEDEWFSAVLQTADQGYLLGGNTKSFGEGSDDIILVRLDSMGNLLWSKTYGTAAQNVLMSLKPDSDGGFLLGIRYTPYNSGIIKINANGIIEWTRIFEDGVYGAQKTNDNGYILHGPWGMKVKLIKLDFLGNTSWARMYGDSLASASSKGSDFVQTYDNGYVMTGSIQGVGAGGTDAILIKLDELGNVIWSKAYGSSGSDQGASVVQLPDSGYLLAGYGFGAGAFIIRTTSNGDTLWSRSFHGPAIDWMNATFNDSEFVFTGSGLGLFKVNINGDTIWKSSISAGNGDGGTCIQPTIDGGFVIVGYTNLFGNGDCYLIKTDNEGSVFCSEINHVFAIVTTQKIVTDFTLLSYTMVPSDAITSFVVNNPPLSDTTLCSFTKVPELASKINFIISPNPFHTTARIETKNSNTKICEIRIFNSMGVIVRIEKGINLDSYVLSRGPLTDGLYFYELRTLPNLQSAGQALNSELIGTGKFVIQ